MRQVRACARCRTFVKKQKLLCALARVRSGSASQSHLLKQSNMEGYDPINKSYSREQLRLADYFEKQQDFYPFSQWPAWLQDVALTCPKDYGQRTGMFLHFARNGVFAPTVRNWVLACDVIGGKLVWSEDYPLEVRMDMARLIKKALSGEIVSPDSKTYQHQTGQVVIGLNPADWPTYKQLQAIRTRAAVQISVPGPERRQPTKRQGVYYPPVQAGRETRLTSGIRYLRGIRGYVTTYQGREYRLYPGQVPK